MTKRPQIPLEVRYHELTDKRLLHGLADAEQAELDAIVEALEMLEADWYAPIIEALQVEC